MWNHALGLVERMELVDEDMVAVAVVTVMVVVGVPCAIADARGRNGESYGFGRKESLAHPMYPRTLLLPPYPHFP